MTACDHHTPSTIRHAVTAWAATEPLVRRVYLFGSRARGHHRPDSDIDLAVLNGIDPAALATCIRSAPPSDMPTGEQPARSAHDWTFEANRDRWHSALPAVFTVPVQLERPQSADRIVRPNLKRSRVLLYRAAGSPG